MLFALALLSIPANARPLDAATFPTVAAGAFTVSSPSTIDVTTGIFTDGVSTFNAVLSEEGAWVFTFDSLHIDAPIDLISVGTVERRPVALLSRGDLIVNAPITGTDQGYSLGPGRSTGGHGAGFGTNEGYDYFSQPPPSAEPGGIWGDLARRLDAGSGAISFGSGGASSASTTALVGGRRRR